MKQVFIIFLTSITIIHLRSSLSCLVVYRYNIVNSQQTHSEILLILPSLEGQYFKMCKTILIIKLVTFFELMQV